MNIFVTNTDPKIAAQELCDKHVRSKMIIESAIMLQHCFTTEQLLKAPYTKSGKPRKSGKGYYKHICSIWTRESRDNFLWLIHHALEMEKERHYRWPDSSNHFTVEFIKWCLQNKDKTTHTSNKQTPFVYAINSNSKCFSLPEFNSSNVVQKYQLYISYDKSFATWTKRTKPAWLKLAN
jgi:hypothetical protein